MSVPTLFQYMIVLRKHYIEQLTKVAWLSSSLDPGFRVVTYDFVFIRSIREATTQTPQMEEYLSGHCTPMDQLIWMDAFKLCIKFFQLVQSFFKSMSK
jgi:hypothetical protein